MMRAGLGTIVALAALAGAIDPASADCTRHIVNRSGYVLVAQPDGGPPFLVPPGRSRAVRLIRPGRFDFAAYCPGQEPGATEPVVRAGFEYEVDGPACSYAFGLYTPYFGRAGYVPDPDPFVLNNPKLGDIVLGPTGPACGLAH